MNNPSKLILVLISGLVVSCGDPESPGPAPAPTPVPEEDPAAESEIPPDARDGTFEIPDRIVAERGGFIPEGIEWDPDTRRFLTGSLADGTIYRIDNEGAMTEAVTDPDLVSSVGIEVDELRNRLLVTNSDRAVFQGDSQGQAMLGVYEMPGGERIAMVDLAASIGSAENGDRAHFANDVTVSEDGTIYVTDTRMNIIYEVDNEYQASVFHRFEGIDGLSINGIEFHPNEYLLVADAGNGSLYKVPVEDPAAAAMVELEEPINGADGIVWASDGRLIAVSNSDSRAVALRSDDDWESAQVTGVASFEGQGTTAAVADDEIYVVQPHFNDDEPPVILRTTFD